MSRQSGHEAFLHSERALQAVLPQNRLTPAQRLGELEGVEADLMRLPSQDQLNSAVLRGQATLCYLPSLEAIATGRPHTHRVAQQVSKNLQSLAQSVVATSDFHHLDGNTLGSLSEVGVLSQLWWGIAYGYMHEGSYANFSTKRQDQSTSSELRDGYDIVMNQCDGHPIRHRIQVKTTKQAARKCAYEPGIAKISPEQLIGAKSGWAVKALFMALASNDLGVLSKGYWRAERILNAAQTAATYQHLGAIVTPIYRNRPNWSPYKPRRSAL